MAHLLKFLGRFETVKPGASAVIGLAGFTGAGAVAMRASAGAAVAGFGQIASTDLRLIQGEPLTTTELAKLPAAMTTGALSALVPI